MRMGPAQNPVIMVAGHVCIDVIPDLSRLKDGFSVFRPGQLAEVGPASFSLGGAVANTGVALHRLAVPVRLVGKVGLDAFGTMIQERLVDALAPLEPNMPNPVRSEADLIIDPAGSTSYSIVLNPANEDRMFLHCTGANDTFQSTDVDTSLWDGIQVFHFGYPPLMRTMYVNDGQGLFELLRQPKKRGILTSLDMAMPDANGASGRVAWMQVLARLLPLVDMFWMSLDEAAYLYNANKQTFTTCHRELTAAEMVEAVAEKCLGLGAKFVGIKLGEAGLYIRTGDFALPDSLCSPEMGHTHLDRNEWVQRELLTPCFRVLPQGTTGAGDTTIAGFLAAMVRGLPITACLNFAVGVGAASVEGKDAVSGIPAFESVRARITEGWQQSEVMIEGVRGLQHVDQVYRGVNDSRKHG